MTFRSIEISDPRYSHEGLRCVTVKSPALKCRGDITLFAPLQPLSPRTPVVILLHGIFSSHWAWALKGGAHRTLQSMIESHEVAPMILAMPSDGLWGDGSGYVRHAVQDFESWIVNEVPAVIPHVLPSQEASAPLFIAGLSMGGFAALRLAAKYPDRFQASSGHSSATHLQQLHGRVEEDIASLPVPREDQDLVEIMLRNRDRLKPFRFDCGADDFLLPANRTLHRQLTRAKIAHQYDEFPGAHDWSYWEKQIEQSYRFFNAQLKPK